MADSSSAVGINQIEYPQKGNSHHHGDSDPLKQPLLEEDGKEDVPVICECCPFDVYPWMMLLFICFVTFGSYWVYDTPGAIFQQLQDWFGGKSKYSNSDNLNLYSIYSWPNCVLAFFGGFIIDRLTGIRMGALLFCALVAVGQLVFCLGVIYRYYYVCLLGRFIFGLGGESLTVAQNAYTIRWFDGKRLAMAFGLVLAFSRIGSAVNFIATPALTRSSVPFAVWFGMGTCAISLTACTLAYIFDWKGEKRVIKQTQPDPSSQLPSMLDIRHFPIQAWILFSICAFFYIAYLTFLGVASDIMQKTGHMYSDTTSGYFLAVPNFMSIILSPTFGRLVDKKGRSLSWILLASVMMILAHLAFLANANEWVDIHPVIIFLWLGVTYSLGAASIWPILSFIVEERFLGTAYGCMTATQNLGLAISTLVIGKLQDHFDGTLKYTLPLLIFIGCAGVSCVLTFLLVGIDKKRSGGKLNASAKERELLNLAAASDKDTDEASTVFIAPEVVPSAPPAECIYGEA